MVAAPPNLEPSMPGFENRRREAFVVARANASGRPAANRPREAASAVENTERFQISMTRTA
jgi:hypothetical protein